MQHTLLPQIERKALRREYRRRALVVFLFTLSVAGLLGVASLVPVFVSAQNARHAAEADLATVKKAKDMSGLTQIQQHVATGIKLLSLLDESAAPPRLSSLSEDIISRRGKIRIQSIDAAYTSTTTAQFTVRGTAPTRDELLSWKSSLESALPGVNVDLPVSELAKATNVDFAVKVTFTFK